MVPKIDITLISPAMPQYLPNRHNHPVLLVALSYYGFTLYCESFGCLGRGLVWMLWAVLAAGGSAVALGVRAWQRHRGLPSRTSGAALALLLTLGAGHGVYWLITTALR